MGYEHLRKHPNASEGLLETNLYQLITGQRLVVASASEADIERSVREFLKLS